MREIRQSGSVRGVRRNPYPYRDPTKPHAKHGTGFILGTPSRIHRKIDYRRQPICDLIEPHSVLMVASFLGTAIPELSPLLVTANTSARLVEVRKVVCRVLVAAFCRE